MVSAGPRRTPRSASRPPRVAARQPARARAAPRRRVTRSMPRRPRRRRARDSSGIAPLSERSRRKVRRGSSERRRRIGRMPIPCRRAQQYAVARGARAAARHRRRGRLAEARGRAQRRARRVSVTLPCRRVTQHCAEPSARRRDGRTASTRSTRYSARLSQTTPGSAPARRDPRPSGCGTPRAPPSPSPPCQRIASAKPRARPSCSRNVCVDGRDQADAPERRGPPLAAVGGEVGPVVGQLRAHVVQQQIGVRMDASGATAPGSPAASPVTSVGTWHAAQPIAANSASPRRTSGSSTSRRAGTARKRA